MEVSLKARDTRLDVTYRGHRGPSGLSRGTRGRGCPMLPGSSGLRRPVGIKRLQWIAPGPAGAAKEGKEGVRV